MNLSTSLKGQGTKTSCCTIKIK